MANSAFRPLRKEDIAEVLGIAVLTVDEWWSNGTIPMPVHIGKFPFWHPDAFYGWLERHLMVQVSDPSSVLFHRPHIRCPVSCRSSSS